MLFCLNAKEAKALHFVFVSSFRFQVCGTKSREVLHKLSRRFFEVDCVEGVARRRFAFLIEIQMKYYFLEVIVPLRGL